MYLFFGQPAYKEPIPGESSGYGTLMLGDRKRFSSIAEIRAAIQSWVDGYLYGYDDLSVFPCPRARLPFPRVTLSVATSNLPISITSPASAATPLPHTTVESYTSLHGSSWARMINNLAIYIPVVATPSSFAEQTNIALDATRAALHLREYQTVAAMGPPPTIGPPPTPDLRPTSVSPWLIKIPGGGYLAQDIGYPSKMPRYLDAWTLDFPALQQSVTVWAGGYLYTPETYDQELLKPEQGAIAVDVGGFRPGMPDRRLDDPRTERLTLPVRDGMARIVDALVTDDRITVMIRTDASAYTYEVHTHTLALAQPPTVEPGGPYQVRAGELLNLEAQGRDLAGTQFEYGWDLDGDGVFEVRSQRATFSARDLLTPQVRTVALRVTARNGLSSTVQVPVEVVAP